MHRLYYRPLIDHLNARDIGIDFRSLLAMAAIHLAILLALFGWISDIITKARHRRELRELANEPQPDRRKDLQDFLHRMVVVHAQQGREQLNDVAHDMRRVMNETGQGMKEAKERVKHVTTSHTAWGEHYR